MRGATFSPLIRKRPIVDGTKECSRCGGVFPVERFDSKPNGGCAPACKPCTSIINRAQRYGMTFDAMKVFIEQPCAGCGATEKLHVDHCHDTGRVRGMLCHYCNTILHERVTPEILRRLADYLES